MKRPEKVTPAGDNYPVPLDSEFSRRHPSLWEMLTCTKWEDGGKRQTTTLFLFVDDGTWKCMVKDRALDVICFVTASTLAGLLESLEHSLANDAADWRKDRPKGGRGK